jgi:hypothetical protein
MANQHSQSQIIGTGCNKDAQGHFTYACNLPDVTDPHEYQCGGANLGRVLEFKNRMEENAASLNEMLTLQVTEFVRHLVSAICIFPLIAFVILLTFVLNTTNLFGGNIPEIGRGLVKLI